jgi:hypothetical protein
MYPQRCEHQRTLGMVQSREPIVIVPFQASITPPRSSHNVLSLRLTILSRPQSATCRTTLTLATLTMSHILVYSVVFVDLCQKCQIEAPAIIPLTAVAQNKSPRGCLNLSSCIITPPLPPLVKTKVSFTFSLSVLHPSPSWMYFRLFHLSPYSASYCRSFSLVYSTSGP